MKITILLLLLILLLSCCARVNYTLNESESDIIERKQIGVYSLSMTKSQLDSLEGVQISKIHIYTTYTLPNVKIWFDNKRNRTDQICAFNGFQGRFRGEISVGDYITKLSTIAEYYFDREELLYQLKSIKGISFDVPEEHLALKENKRKIDYICIYR